MFKNTIESPDSGNCSKKQKIQSESDTASIASFDCDDLIVYSPESFDGNDSDQCEDKLCDKATFLQFENCYKTSLQLPQCRECRNDTEVAKYSCRFYMFRKIEKDNDGSFKVVGYLDQLFDTSLAEIDIWTKPDASILKDVDSVAQLYILRCVSSQFCELVKEEEDVLKLYHKERPSGIIAWKRAVYKVREMCDTCATSIFNYHYVCEQCGIVVCIDCYKERKENKIVWKMTKSDREERDKFYWLKCTNELEKHFLILSKMIPGNALTNLNDQLHSFCDAQNIKLMCGCRDKTIKPARLTDKIEIHRNITKARRKKQRINLIRHRKVSNFDENLQKVQHSYVSSGTVLKFQNPLESHSAFSLFQCEWERGKPIVVGDVKGRLKPGIWSPEFFLNNFGTIKHSLVNCQSDSVIKRVPMKDFWMGFKSYESRLPSGSPNKLVLKLKDWPDTQDFADVLVDHYDDMMRNIPMPKYSRRDGIYNLARYQHPHFLKPDLGPKLYCAYGNFEQSRVTKGSTNLHLDISDAVNILVHVSRPDDYHLATKQYDKVEIRKALELAGVSEEDLKIFMTSTSERLPGAIWHIFHSTDVSKIRKALHEYANENQIQLKSYEDPIHNQDWYVDAKLKLALQQKGINSYTIIQYEGDCIFVPAKTPHQVTNIFDCIKIALDFVSPENITECFTLTNEFRLLSTRHANREDKLQIKSILYHTVKNLIQPKENF